MNINLVGAFDRNNYGDLLFPIITQSILEKIAKENKSNNNFEFNYIGVKESDMREYGGSVTKPLSYLNGQENSITILVGGEILGTNFMGMDLCFDNNPLYVFGMKAFNKVGGGGIINKYLKVKYNTKQNHPWIPTIDFMLKNKVIFNSVGGSKLNFNNRNLINSINSSLEYSNYFSVRDEKTYRLLETINPKTKDKVVISPDSAVIMSDIFPKEKLEKLTTSESQNYIDKNRDYIVFQVSQKIARGREREIAKQLDLLGTLLKVGIVLLPIGRAPEHDDHKALIEISENMTSSNFLPRHNTIYDTMSLIGNSKLYIGTSLHGAITAISYNLPHVAFTNQVTKLNEFLKTWETTKIYSTDTNSLIKDAERLISQPYDISKINEKMKMQVKNNFNNIYEYICS
ncbi:polysaccharide pyruvyl transferase family protein [Peribacillus sp. NPDC096447]|uniref:polysaccharide pyruvyl transferase family protein n=1 Tax=Peribacillus sp. NPDC096447 TaxID=3364394 RepID=UPI0038019C21